ncbi:YeiH family protein [Azospirillum sp. RWY-5-1]|uniref:YeiH family protein n=1 Tax=Azospirillum oleiclasticum TaxID=2735135 RepID=A0ABX2TE27_9PROT|nr:YeiH family protein [Azospirillum oleiclasticum]NYZ14062.1 YeiH family protein [Azospirillum oleiclasticum]NYZ21546.1 YeiH family protein [Azospirillum oleiclasticum]
MNAHAPARQPAASLASPTTGLWPGLLLSAGIAGLAMGLNRLPGLAAVSPMILSIVIGMAIGNTLGIPASARAGVVFAMRRLLRAAIVLLGLQLSAAQVMQVGASGVAVIAATLGASFLFTLWLGRRLGVERGLTELIAAGTAICGASAVVAANTVTRARDEDVAYAVACVTVFGSLAMVAYPLLAGLMGLGPHAFGLWAGASIHEVAQVVAAAFQAGPQAGEFGTIAKLTRVMMLAPVVLLLGLVAAQRMGGAGRERASVPVPWFVLGFAALAALNSVVTIPTGVKEAAGLATGFLLSTALAAMGLETDVGKLRAKGLRPLLLGFASALFIAAVGLALVTVTL